MDDVIDDINNYNKNRDKKVLIVFDNMIAVSTVFITQSYFRALKYARLNSTHHILMKIGNKKELKSTAEESQVI